MGFLVDEEGLRASHELMELWLDAAPGYEPRHGHVLIGPLRADQYDYLRSVTFYVNADQLAVLVTGSSYYSRPEDPPVTVGSWSPCLVTSTPRRPSSAPPTKPCASTWSRDFWPSPSPGPCLSCSAAGLMTRPVHYTTTSSSRSSRRAGARSRASGKRPRSHARGGANHPASLRAVTETLMLRGSPLATQTETSLPSAAVMAPTSS